MPATSPDDPLDSPNIPFLTLLEMLGEGSFGKVFKALHHVDNQIVAVKVVPIEDDNGDLEREIQYLKECDMRYIVQFLGSFEHTDRLWIMMEYCEGSSLLDVMGATGKCLTQVQVAAALYCCLAALIYLHERNRVHRDVKAGNLLLTSEGVVKLADFGVAATINAGTAARRRTVIGTPFWMAPEVITCRAGGGSKGYDQLADVWSLGITAIELAEGQPPHSSVSPLTAIFLIPTLPAPNLSEPRQWSSEFRAFIPKCVCKDPDKRVPSAALATDAFLVGGSHAVGSGELRQLMAASREPLRSFRDHSAAKKAAKKERRAAAEEAQGGRARSSSQTLPRPSGAGGSAAGDGPAAAPSACACGASTLRRSCDSPHGLRRGGAGSSSAQIDFAAIRSVASMMAKEGGSSGTARAQPRGAWADAEPGGTIQAGTTLVHTGDTLRAGGRLGGGNGGNAGGGGGGGGGCAGASGTVNVGTMLVHSGGTLRAGHGCGGGGGGVSGGGDQTMVVRDTGTGQYGTMVVKPGVAAALGAASAAGGDGGGDVGTMLLVREPSISSGVGGGAGGGGDVNGQPFFMRKMFGTARDEPTDPPPSQPPNQPSSQRDEPRTPHKARADERQDAAADKFASGGRRPELPIVASSRSEERLSHRSSHGPSQREEGGGVDGSHNRRSSGGRVSSRHGVDFSTMGIETLSKELATLSADMERDIGKVYRKYERLERTIRAERDRKLAERDRKLAALSLTAQANTRNIM